MREWRSLPRTIYPPTGEPLQLVDTRQAASMLAVSPRMVVKLRDQGELAERRIGRALRFDVRDLEHLVGLDDDDAPEGAGP
jgi:hypothetical protein